ncbi:MAG TPA: acyl-CoA dehydrogenase [Thermohalobaculum sp.]|nr:acyl-CoA dehydrogenase [Thermohalobaculum sp.]
MDFNLSEERQMLKDTAGRFLREQYPIDKRHEFARGEDGFSRAMWAEFGDLGLIGALMPPEVGGYGGTGEDIALVFEELGRGLVVEPFLASGVLAASPLIDSGDAGTLAGVIAGTGALAFAHGEPEGRYGLSHVASRAEQGTDGWRLTGRKAMVLNGSAADCLIVSARLSGEVTDQGGLGLFRVDPAQSGVTRRSYAVIDGAAAAEITLDGATGIPIGTPGEAFPMIERAIGRGVLAVCAEALGAMEVAKDLTVEYLKTRVQFGQPIGANQVLQHRMVDLLIEIEQVRSCVMLAASTLDADRATRERHLSAAKHLVGRVGRQVAEEAIQMHGGIAMTWEATVPHYAKRIVMIDHLFGDTDYHLDRFIRFSREAS